MREVQSDGSFKVRRVLAESVREAREPASLRRGEYKAKVLSCPAWTNPASA